MSSFTEWPLNFKLMSVACKRLPDALQKREGKHGRTGRAGPGSFRFLDSRLRVRFYGLGIA